MTAAKAKPLYEAENGHGELSTLAYERWCQSSAQEFIVHDEMRVINLHEIIHSVIEADFTPAERSAATLHWFEGMSVASISERLGISRAGIYKALARGNDKLRLVLKHLINCEIYKTENEAF